MPHISIESATQLCLNFEYLYEKWIVLKVLHDLTSIALTFRSLSSHFDTDPLYKTQSTYPIFTKIVISVMKEKISSNNRKIEGKQLKVHILLSNSIHNDMENLAYHQVTHHAFN